MLGVLKNDLQNVTLGTIILLLRFSPVTLVCGEPRECCK